MNERSSRHKKKEHDFAVTAFRVFQEAIGEKSEPEEEAPELTPKKRHAAASGKKGGLARAKKLTPEKRKEIARETAEARWRKDT